MLLKPGLSTVYWLFHNSSCGSCNSSADSADALKRNRGRRGLDILQRIQKNKALDVQIAEADYPKIQEVDLKLIELAKDTDGKIVTNDFNLNKVRAAPGCNRSQHQ